MRSAFHEIARRYQGKTHHAVPNHKGCCCILLLGERQELPCKLVHHVTVERVEVGDKHAVEDREQQKRIFQRLAECFSLFDQQPCPLRSRSGFGRSIPFDMEQWGYEGDLKLYPLSPQR